MCPSLYVPPLLASFTASPLHCQLFLHLATSPYFCFLFSASVFSLPILYHLGFVHPFIFLLLTSLQLSNSILVFTLFLFFFQSVSHPSIQHIY